MNTLRIALATLLLAGLSIAVPATAQAQPALADYLRTNPKFLQTFRTVVADASQSTVRIRSAGKDVALGVIVDSDGWILTKAFDLKGPIVCRLNDGRERAARIVGVHAIHDLALLKIDATGLSAVRFQPSKAMPAGSWVASAGTGADPVAVGVVSVPTRDVKFKGLPIAATELSQIGYLGVALEPAHGGGLRILAVMSKSAAEQAGLRPDDIIRSVAGAAVDDPEQFQMHMLKRKPGDTVKLHVSRGDDELDVEPKLQKRPAADGRGELQNHMGSTLSARRSGYPTILTHDSVVLPTDCGGPLVDLDGRVVGINISRAGRTESWAIPTEVIAVLLPELRAGTPAPAPAASREAERDTGR